MIKIVDQLAGERIRIFCPESKMDLRQAARFLLAEPDRALDTEGTGINVFKPGWAMRTFQYGDANTAFVIPARYKLFIGWAMRQDIHWYGHNLPHDVRTVDRHLGYETGVVGDETFIPLHYHDSRNQGEGGIGHGLKEGAQFFVDRDAGRWEKDLKAEFKKIEVPIPGEVYKSGPRKGTQKMRKIKLSEGWEHIDPKHPAYIAYAGLDPILTFRLVPYLRRYVEEFPELYAFDKAVQNACDVLQRRGIRCYTKYTSRLGKRYTRMADSKIATARALVHGFDNINSTQQIAEALISLDIELTETTDTGKWKMDARILRSVMTDPYANEKAKLFVRTVLVAKQLLKRRKSYTDAMLREMDEDYRVHASINSMAARTARMSVSNPALQQLPTKDHEDEIFWDDEEDYEDVA